MILDALNPPQRTAASFKDEGHCLILAGAGSGKTRVITHRIAHLIYEKGINPYKILAFTFTNKAAAEMKKRTAALLDEKCDTSYLTISTFHSYGARFLRKYAESAELTSSFTIYDETEQAKLLKDILKDNGKRNEEIKAIQTSLLHAFEQYKEQSLTEEQIKERSKTRLDEETAFFYKLYNQHLRKNNAVDFADLIYLPNKILEENPFIMESIQNRYLHILVDEYQDTNPAQIRLIKNLAGSKSQITAVGDDDQSIYTWRGADPKAILEFEQIFGKTTRFKLEQNYRSTNSILKTANTLIANNTTRFEKQLWTESSTGTPVLLNEYATDKEEAIGVVLDILRRKREYHLKNSDFAILFRTNNQHINFELMLRKNGFRDNEFEIVGGLSFFERSEIKDLLAYLRVIANPCDAVALLRALQAPKRGIGDKAFQKLIEAVYDNRKKGTPEADCLFVALQDVADGKLKIGNKSAQEGALQFLRLLIDIRRRQDRLCNMLAFIVDSVGFIRYIEQKCGQGNIVDIQETTQRIYKLIDMLDDFEKGPEDTLQVFLENMVLIQPDVDEEDNVKRDTIKLMTIHSAKGLEFPVVYLTGLEEDLLPFSRNGEVNIEEERRLAYVAITRAKIQLVMSYAKRRNRFMSQDHFAQESYPSSFLREMRAYSSPHIQTNNVFNSDSNYFSSKQSSIHYPSKQNPPSSSSKFEADDPYYTPKPAQPKKNYTSPASKAIPQRPDKGFTQSFQKKPKQELSYENCNAFPDYENESQDWESALAKCKKNAGFAPGTHVSHPKFGLGEVISSSECPEGFKVEVNFPMFGTKTILSKFLRKFS